MASPTTPKFVGLGLGAVINQYMGVTPSTGKPQVTVTYSACNDENSQLLWLSINIDLPWDNLTSRLVGKSTYESQGGNASLGKA